MRQTLSALTAMRIRFPGKTEEEAEAVLDEVGARFVMGKKICQFFCQLFSGIKNRKIKKTKEKKIKTLLLPGLVFLQCNYNSSHFAIACQLKLAFPPYLK